MGLLKKIGLGILGVVILLTIVAFLLPRTAHMERSIAITAPRATVFSILHGFRSFNKWSPWAEMDPQARYTYEGPDFGVGAKQTWSGNPKTVGTGYQQITEVRPPESITSDLDFGAQGKAVTRFLLASDGRGTRVTWILDADMGMNPVSRYFGLMFDRMMGPDFEKGLAKLKIYAESLPKVDFDGLPVEKVTVQSVPVAFLPATSSRDDQAIAAAIGAAYHQVGLFIAAQGLKMTGAPITINTRLDDAGYAFDAAVPVDRFPDQEVDLASPVKVKQTYAGPALKVVHKGPYHGLTATYEKIYTFAAANSYEPAGSSWDEYVSDPGNTPEAELITNVFVPVK